MTEKADEQPGEAAVDRPGAEPAFRVVDRRRFAPDGSERKPEEEVSPSAAPASGGETSDAASSTGSSMDGPSAGTLDAPTFSTLILSLSTQALMLLGEIPDPTGGTDKQESKDLPAARHMIDLLGVLQTKTKGNLDRGESELLDRILYDLRVRFVQLSRQP